MSSSDYADKPMSMMPNLNSGALRGTDSFASSGATQVKAGDTVIYHASDGDVEATLVRFTGIGANLQIGDAELRDVRRGPNEGHWEPTTS